MELEWSKNHYEKIKNKKENIMKITVAGVGYVGLSLAVLLARSKRRQENTEPSYDNG